MFFYVLRVLTLVRFVIIIEHQRVGEQNRRTIIRLVAMRAAEVIVTHVAVAQLVSHQLNLLKRQKQFLKKKKKNLRKHQRKTKAITGKCQP